MKAKKNYAPALKTNTFRFKPAGQVLDTLRSNEKNLIKGLSAPIKTDTTNETEKENDHGLYCN